MDPNACLLALTRAIENENFDAAAEHAEALHNWLRGGGFAPSDELKMGFRVVFGEEPTYSVLASIFQLVDLDHDESDEAEEPLRVPAVYLYRAETWDAVSERVEHPTRNVLGVLSSDGTAWGDGCNVRPDVVFAILANGEVSVDRAIKQAEEARIVVGEDSEDEALGAYAREAADDAGESLGRLEAYIDWEAVGRDERLNGAVSAVRIYGTDWAIIDNTI